jgi:hypothetical protein
LEIHQMAAAYVNQFVEAAEQNDVAEMRRLIAAGVDKDGIALAAFAGDEVSTCFVFRGPHNM